MDAHKKLTGNRNQCPSCHEYFNSLGAFDRHRTGYFGKNRQCRTTEGMLGAGMVKNADGFWITGLMPEHYSEQVRNANSADFLSHETQEDTSTKKSLLAEWSQQAENKTCATKANETNRWSHG